MVNIKSKINGNRCSCGCREKKIVIKCWFLVLSCIDIIEIYMSIFLIIY